MKICSLFLFLPYSCAKKNNTKHICSSIHLITFAHR